MMKFFGRLYKKKKNAEVKRRVDKLLQLCSDKRKETNANAALNSSLQHAEDTLASIRSALDLMSKADVKLDLPVKDVENFLSVLKEGKKLMGSKEVINLPEDQLKKLADSFLRFRHQVVSAMMRFCLGETEKNRSVVENPIGLLMSSVSEVLRLCEANNNGTDLLLYSSWLKFTVFILSSINRILSQTLSFSDENRVDIPVERMERFVLALIHVKALVSSKGNCVAKFYKVKGLHRCLLSFYCDTVMDYCGGDDGVEDLVQSIMKDLFISEELAMRCVNLLNFILRLF